MLSGKPSRGPHNKDKLDKQPNMFASGCASHTCTKPCKRNNLTSDQFICSSFSFYHVFIMYLALCLDLCRLHAPRDLHPCSLVSSLFLHMIHLITMFNSVRILNSGVLELNEFSSSEDEHDWSIMA